MTTEVIVAVGGGSALDTAKALMVGTESGEFDALVALLATGKPFTPHRVKSLIAVPTTSGTGSEVTGWATVWHQAAGKKYSAKWYCCQCTLQKLVFAEYFLPAALCQTVASR